TMQTEINLPYITADASGPKDINIYRLGRVQLENLMEPLIKCTVDPQQRRWK
ncbi:hypothetical protein DFJ58DRAFT_643153, partial [Suillus subalutaceus]|uniref:uncharacterized protein n=1 Tax=Suillus subalutaceus TaxID=48586 RepID=UPI001B86A3FD